MKTVSLKLDKNSVTVVLAIIALLGTMYGQFVGNPQFMDQYTKTLGDLQKQLEVSWNPTFYTLQKQATYVLDGLVSGATIYYTMQNGTTGKLDYYSTVAFRTITYAIDNTTNFGGGIVFMKQHVYPVNSSILMKSNVTVEFESGVYINQTVAGQNTFFFSHVTKAHLLVDGYATIHGFGADEDTEALVKMHYSNSCSIVATGKLELAHSAKEIFTADIIFNCIFENLYCHDSSRYTGYPTHLFTFEGWYNTFKGLYNDAEFGANTRSTMLVSGVTLGSCWNTITDSVFCNTHDDNAVYLGGWTGPVTHNTLINIMTINSSWGGTGHAGIKLRPANYTTVLGWQSINDMNGLSMGTCYDSESQLDGCFYNYIEGSIILTTFQNENGVIMVNDGDDNARQTCSYNELHLMIQNSSYPFMTSFSGAQASYNKIYLTIADNPRSFTAPSIHGNFTHNYLEILELGAVDDALLIDYYYAYANTIMIDAPSGNHIADQATATLTSAHNTNYFVDCIVSGKYTHWGGIVTNTTATTIVFNHLMLGAPEEVFLTTATSGLTLSWTTSATQITVTATGTLPATWTVYWEGWLFRFPYGPHD